MCVSMCVYGVRSIFWFWIEATILLIAVIFQKKQEADRLTK